MPSLSGCCQKRHPRLRHAGIAATVSHNLAELPKNTFYFYFPIGEKPRWWGAVDSLILLRAEAVCLTEAGNGHQRLNYVQAEVSNNVLSKI